MKDDAPRRGARRAPAAGTGEVPDELRANIRRIQADAVRSPTGSSIARPARLLRTRSRRRDRRLSRIPLRLAHQRRLGRCRGRRRRSRPGLPAWHRRSPPSRRAWARRAAPERAALVGPARHPRRVVRHQHGVVRRRALRGWRGRVGDRGGGSRLALGGRPDVDEARAGRIAVRRHADGRARRRTRRPRGVGRGRAAGLPGPGSCGACSPAPLMLWTSPTGSNGLPSRTPRRSPGQPSARSPTVRRAWSRSATPAGTRRPSGSRAPVRPGRASSSARRSPRPISRPSALPGRATWWGAAPAASR